MRTALLLYALASAGCATTEAPPVGDGSERATVPDHHNARNALDWAGTYEGELPGVGFSRLLLEADETYVLEQGEIVHGRFAWLPDGNTIELDEAAGGQRIFINENYVIWLPPDGERPVGEEARRLTLRKVADPPERR